MTLAIDANRLIARLISVPSKGGISHNPVAEFTAEADLIASANVLLDIARKLSQ
jgi:beta-ureidopropionase / N-carbamoyl-L-amino-acid hydrolase